MKSEGSFLELGFVRTGVPGTSQAHPTFFSFLFCPCTSLSGLSEEHPRSTLQKSISELELKYFGNIGYVLVNRLPNSMPC